MLTSDGQDDSLLRLSAEGGILTRSVHIDQDEATRSHDFALPLKGVTIWQAQGAGLRKRDFRPEKFGELLPHMALLRVLGPPYDFQCAVFGGHQRQHFGGDLTGRRLSEIIDQRVDAHPAGTALITAAQRCEPLFFRLSYVNLNVVRKTAACVLLPLLDDAGQSVTALLSVAQFETLKA